MCKDVNLGSELTFFSYSISVQWIRSVHWRLRHGQGRNCTDMSALQFDAEIV